MILYRYNEETKEYLDSIPACLDPMASKREGKPIYVILQNSTMVEPSFEEGKVPVFNGENWDLVSDYRGKIVYKKNVGTPLLITELGEIPTGYVLEKPVLLQDLKADKIIEVNNVFNNELQNTVELKGMCVKGSDRSYFLKKLEESKNFKYVAIEIEDRVIGKIAETKDIEYVANFLYLRDIYLSVRKKELIKNINKCKNKKDVTNMVISFKIPKKIEKQAEKSLEEVEEYIKEMIKG